MPVVKKCPHGRLRYECRNCGGKGVCIHGRRRNTCHECSGSLICQHGRQRQACADCNNFICDEGACEARRFSSTQALLKHMRTCHGDDPKAVTKRKELEIHQLLREAGIRFEYQHYLPFATCGLASETQRAFVDFVILTTWGGHPA